MDNMLVAYTDNKMKYGIFALDLQYIIPTKQQFILPPSFRWEDYFSANQAQELPMPIMFFVQSGWYYRGTSIYTAWKISLYLVKWFQMRRCLEIDQLETRIANGDHVC